MSTSEYHTSRFHFIQLDILFRIRSLTILKQSKVPFGAGGNYVNLDVHNTETKNAMLPLI